MIAVLQRVLNGLCIADGTESGRIGKGLVIMLGVEKGDTEADATVLAAKIAKNRIFSDSNDKMNLSLIDISGEALVISNFTLCANYAHGNRPDYLNAEKPEQANRLYVYFVDQLKTFIKYVATGVFGADMKISLTADGPITMVMDSKILLKR